MRKLKIITESDEDSFRINGYFCESLKRVLIRPVEPWSTSSSEDDAMDVATVSLRPASPQLELHNRSTEIWNNMLNFIMNIKQTERNKQIVSTLFVTVRAHKHSDI